MRTRLVILLVAVFVTLLLLSCGPKPTSPTNTPTPTSSTTMPTWTVTAVPSLTSTPNDQAQPLVVADFDSCASANNLGGPMGAAYDPPDSLAEFYVEEQSHGCVARLEYDIAEWSVFWMKLQGVDLTPYGELTFDIKGESHPQVPGAVKIELKRAENSEVSIVYVSGITTDWQTISLRLEDLGSTGYTAPLSTWMNMEELVFTFEASRSGPRGVVYLDNIVFQP